MGKPRKVDKSAIDTAAAENTGSDPATGESATAGSNNDQPLITHLLELRDRLMRVLLAVGICFVIMVPFAGKIYSFVALPLIKSLPIESSLIAIGAAAPFFAPFKLVMVLSIFIAIPVILYQAWKFIAPGLYAHERRMIMPMVTGGTVLFYTGGLFAWFVVMPLFFSFMAKVTPEGVQYLPDISSTLDIILKFLIGFGVAFQIPIAIILLVYAKAVQTAKLRSLRPYIFLGCFVVSMLMTPPDPMSQTLLAIPMYLLFEIGLLIATRIEKPMLD